MWLASGGTLQKKYATYLAIVDESVAGLNINAPVKYNGVDVGKVRSIQLDTNDPEKVRLLFAIEVGTPIKVDTVAVLKTQGLTGIAYIELDGGAKNAAILTITANAEYPIIRTKPSLSTRLENILTSVLAKLDNTTNNIDHLLNNENRQAIKSILADIASVSNTLAKRNALIDSSIVDTARLTSNTAKASEKLNPILDKIPPEITQLSDMIAQIKRSAIAIEMAANAAAIAGGKVGNTVAIVGGNINQYATDTLPEVQRLLGELSALAITLKTLSEQIERDPASLIRGKSNVPDGPGEFRGESKTDNRP